MNKNLILLISMLIIVSLLSSCKKQSILCGGNDPDKNLPWLKQEIQRLSTLNSCNSISRSTYKEQTVFILSSCEPNASSIPLLFNCDGNQLNLSAADYQDLKFTGSIELIWKSK